MFQPPQIFNRKLWGGNKEKIAGCAEPTSRNEIGLNRLTSFQKSQYFANFGSIFSGQFCKLSWPRCIDPLKICQTSRSKTRNDPYAHARVFCPLNPEHRAPQDFNKYRVCFWSLCSPNEVATCGFKRPSINLWSVANPPLVCAVAIARNNKCIDACNIVVGNRCQSALLLVNSRPTGGPWASELEPFAEFNEIRRVDRQDIARKTMLGISLMQRWPAIGFYLRIGNPFLGFAICVLTDFKFCNQGLETNTPIAIGRLSIFHMLEKHK